MIFGKKHHGACRGAKDQSTALEYEANIKEQISLEHRGIIEKQIPLKQVFKEYLVYSKINNAEKTYRDNKHKAEVMENYFKNIEFLQELKPLHIDKFKADMIAQGKSNATFNRYFSSLSKAINLAIVNHDLSMQNPCKKSGKLLEDNMTTRFLSEDEEKRLFEELPKYLVPIVICALQTGLRLSNILNLTWEQVDLERNIISIKKSQNKGRKNLQVPISPKLKKVLLTQAATSNGYVFVSHRTGTKYKNISDGFNAACERAGIKNFRFHDLRHTVGTRCIENGVDIRTTQELLGHSSITVTQRYLHSTVEKLRGAIDILNGF